MGSFQGHALPGSIFMVFGLWWITQIPRRALLCKQRNIRYFSTMTFPVPVRRLARWPLEGIFKVIGCAVGIAGEMFAASEFGKAGGFIYMGDLQHATMYSAFLIAGIIDILTYRGVGTRLPRKLDYLASGLAFAVEGMLFKFHLHGRKELDVVVHQLLLYVVGACVVLTLLEAKYDRCLTLTWCRAYATLLQGLWFLSVGFMLYPPLPGMKHWLRGHDPDDVTLVVLVFGWHVAGAFIFALLLYMFTYFTYQRHCRRLDVDVEYQLSIDPSLNDLWLKARIGRLGSRTLFSSNDVSETSGSDEEAELSRQDLIPASEISEDETDISPQASAPK